MYERKEQKNNFLLFYVAKILRQMFWIYQKITLGCNIFQIRGPGGIPPLATLSGPEGLIREYFIRNDVHLGWIFRIRMG